MNEAKRYDYVDDIDYGTDVAISDFPQTLEEVECELRQAEQYIRHLRYALQ